MALLSAVSGVEFATIRGQLEVSDSVLSKHLAALADKEYLTSRKGSHRGKRTTWVSQTARGRKALVAHSAALRAILDDVV